MDAFEIVLADRHTVFLDGLTAVLTQLGHRVLGTADSPEELRAELRAFRPQLCITDVDLRGSDDAGVIGSLSSASPATRIVVLTADGDARTMHRALEAGAAGYMHKTRGISVLVDMLRRVVAGEIVIEASFQRPQPSPAVPPQLLRLATYLTAREQECLALLTAGRDTRGMAAELGVSTTTVRSHVQAVLTKLGVHSRLEAASLAIRFRLVPGVGDAAPDAPVRLDARDEFSSDRMRPHGMRARGRSALTGPRAVHASEARAAR